jgi:hypothetical protein
MDQIAYWLCVALGVVVMVSLFFIPRDDGSRRYNRECVMLCGVALIFLSRLLPRETSWDLLGPALIVASVLGVLAWRFWWAARNQANRHMPAPRRPSEPG